jgi:predicted ATPase
MIDALGIKEESKKTTEETLIDFLKEKEILILLDNCEQLIHACADLTERLLSSCPKLKIIATSREALNCGEKRHTESRRLQCLIQIQITLPNSCSV